MDPPCLSTLSSPASLHCAIPDLKHYYLDAGSCAYCAWSTGTGTSNKYVYMTLQEAYVQMALTGAAILYQTQAIIREFPVAAHVAGALALFSSVMTLFWYILQLVGVARD